MKGSPMHRNFGVGASPLEQETKEEHANQGTTVYEGRDNEKGQSQKDILDMRKKKVKNYIEAVDKVAEENDGLTPAQKIKATENLQIKKDKYQFSADSISNVNTIMNADFDKKNEEIKKKNEDEDDPDYQTKK